MSKIEFQKFSPLSRYHKPLSEGSIRQEPEHLEIAKILADNFTPEEYNDSDFEWCAFQLVQAGYHKTREGKWIRYPLGSGIYCSECKHKRRYRDANDAFCPNCGAKMKGANNDR